MRRRKNCVPLLALYLIVTVLAVASTGCASFGARLKSFLGGKVEAPEKPAAPKETTFNETPYHMNAPHRQYRRVTKKSIEEESQLESNAGSLWVNEGQGAYLFSQNIMRMIGDPLTVKIEGDPKAQLVAKVETVKKLLDKLEARRAMLRAPAADGAEPAEAPANPEEGAANTAANKPVAKAVAKPGAPADFAVKMVPTRIVERLVDGNYRVKGTQPVMIGPREYKVIVTGIVRAEDFSDEGISASQLIDPKFDIVSPRRKEIE